MRNGESCSHAVIVPTPRRRVQFTVGGTEYVAVDLRRDGESAVSGRRLLGRAPLDLQIRHKRDYERLYGRRDEFPEALKALSRVVSSHNLTGYSNRVQSISWDGRCWFGPHISVDELWGRDVLILLKAPQRHCWRVRDWIGTLGSREFMPCYY